MIHPRTPPSSTDVAGHYDELDDFYREVWGEHLHHGLWTTGRESVARAVRALIDEVAQRAQIRAGDRVIDVGMGYGGTSRVLASEYGARVTGLTLSPRQYAYARSQDPYSTNPVYLLRDWLHNDLAGDSADAIVSIECIGHVTNKVRFFDEVHRVLRPGGRLALTAWLSGPDPTDEEQRKYLTPICEEGRLGGLATANELRAAAQEAGLVVEGVASLGDRVRRTWSIVVRRVLRRVATQPRYLRFLLDKQAPERGFARSLFRMGPAYRSGALDYGLLWGRRPDESRYQ
jgi:tocopherol O-methyltransferase